MGGELVRIKLSNQVTFLNKASLTETLHQIPEQTHLVIDATETTLIPMWSISSVTINKTWRLLENSTEPGRLQSSILKNDLSHDLSVSTQDIQAKVTPSEVLQLMKVGNAHLFG